MSATFDAPPKLEKKPVKFSNLLLGAGLNMFEVREEVKQRLLARGPANNNLLGYHSR